MVRSGCHIPSIRIAYTAALWRRACEPVASWLAQSFGRAIRAGTRLTDDRKMIVQQTIQPKQLEQEPRLDPLTLPAFSGPARRPWPIPLQRGLKDDPVPLMCWECGRALGGKQLRFCSVECAGTFPVDQLYRRARGLASDNSRKL
jgi:hypothetical protein